MKGTINRDSVLLIAGLAGLAALFLFVVYLPGRKERARIESEIVAASREITRIPDDAARLDALRDEIELRKEYLHATRPAVPTSDELHHIVRDVAAIADDAGLKLSRLEPQSPVNNESYRQIPLRVGFDGEFDRVGRFLRGLEQEQRLISVRGLTLDGKSRKSARNIEGTLDFLVYARHAENSDSAESGDSADGFPSDTRISIGR